MFCVCLFNVIIAIRNFHKVCSIFYLVNFLYTTKKLSKKSVKHYNSLNIMNKIKFCNLGYQDIHCSLFRIHLLNLQRTYSLHHRQSKYQINVLVIARSHNKLPRRSFCCKILKLRHNFIRSLKSIYAMLFYF